MSTKDKYEKPIILVTEIELDDIILSSGINGQGLFGFEEIWGNEQ